MKIFLDPQTFNIQKFGGISRYFSEIYKVAKTDKSIQIVLPLYYSQNLHIKDLIYNDTNFFYKLGIKIGFLRKKIHRKLIRKNKKLYTKTFKNKNFDVFIPTYYDTKFLNLIGGKPFVLTVYDMIHELFPQYFLDDLDTIKNKKILIEKATKIIAISESTKKDILRFNPEIDSSKIEVIYLSQSINLDSEIIIDLPKKYILFVGNRTIYKNFNFFIKSISKYILQNKDLFLVCAGGNKFSEDELELLSDLKILNQVIQQNFEDDELAYFYKNAQCFVFPSEYEGFGIPVLESMVSGCPVILAKHSSFLEVAGDAGVFFELNNSIDLVNKIDLIIKDMDFRSEIIEKGYLQSNKFNWTKTANECLKVFQNAINKC